MSIVFLTTPPPSSPSLPPSLPLQPILAATEQFNCKPKQGIWFLREQGYLRSPLEPGQLADFLLEMPGLAQQGQDWGLPGGQEELEEFVR